jgi:hypothetical protein
LGAFCLGLGVVFFKFIKLQSYHKDMNQTVIFQGTEIPYATIIRTPKVEQASLAHEMFGKQLDLLPPTV